MESSIDVPSTQTSVATQTDGATTTQETATGTHTEAPINGNGRKKPFIWNHFEKLKIEEDVTKPICSYFKKSYDINSKSYGTSNLLAHVSLHVSTIAYESAFLT